MPLGNGKSDPSFQEEFVPVVFARSVEEAEQYCQLLKDHNIEAIIDTEDFGTHIDMDVVGASVDHGLPVLVSEMYLDEANGVIANRENINGFDLNDEDNGKDEDDEYSLEEENDDPEIMLDGQNAPEDRQRFDDDPDDKSL